MSDSSEKTPEKIVVSACLLGRKCRFDGGDKNHAGLRESLLRMNTDLNQVVVVCPEELAGLGTPRPAASLNCDSGSEVWLGRGQVRENLTGRDVSEAFKRGAKRAADLARHCTVAILKDKSPSCGVDSVWRDGELVLGHGVFTSLLLASGVRVMSENGFDQDKSEGVSHAKDRSNTEF